MGSETNVAPMSFALITMGCAKNEVDSAKMAQALSSAGYVQTEPDSAAVIIVNTCSFIQDATEESLAAIFDLNDLDNVASGETRIVVAGCMPARYGEELEQELTEAAAFVPCSKEDGIVEQIAALIGRPEPGDVRVAPAAAQGGVSAYVKISDGCDRFCSYCAIPYIRGRYHSFTYEAIEADVAESIAAGAREIVLIAQDTGRWGQDFEPATSLAQLMKGLAEAHPDTWFRVMYLQPEGITDEFLQVMASHDNICSYLDIPLQHVDQTLLRSMRRPGNREQFEELIEHIREVVPDVTLRTTLIAGYPGETDDQFDELCDFVEQGYFDYVGVFAYSQEEGTAAAELEDQVPMDERRDRAQRVRDIADAVSISMVAERVGRTERVLIEGAEEDGQLFGRAMSQAPDVDGSTYVDAGQVGDIVEVQIVDTMFYEMEGEVAR